MSWTIESQTEASVETPPPGFIRFFPDNSSIKYKNDSGTVFTLATGLTQEQVEDIVGALIVAGSSKQSVVYDDIGNTLTIDVVESEIVHQNLSGAGTNTHAQIDAHIANLTNPHGTTAAQIGADPAGTAATEVQNHVLLSDPHQQYLLEDDAADVATSGNHSDLTLNDGTNPHGTTKSDVGLSNVPNVDATDRATHTGTQTASTISDFDAALATYLDRSIFQDNDEQVNTTTAFVDRLNESINPQHTATYKIRFNYTWAYDAGNTSFIGELLVNGVVVREHEQEPKETGGSDGGAGTDQRLGYHMEFDFDADQGVPFDVQYRFRSEAGGVESTIRDSNLTVERYI